MDNQHTFVAPEGVYSLTDDIRPSPFANSTSTTPIHSPYASRVSTIVITYAPTKQSLAVFPNLNLLGKDKDKEKPKVEKEKENVDKTSLSGSSERTEDDNTGTNSTSPDLPSESNTNTNSTHPSSQVPHLFSPAPMAMTITRTKSTAKPKHNIRTTSSSFVTRINTIEGLSKYLATKQGDVTYLFYNHARTFYWTEQAAKHKEPLARITFSSHPTSHSINTTTASPSRIDIIIGFATSDLIWFDAISSRYVRINKASSITGPSPTFSSPTSASNGVSSGSMITSVKWVPGSERMFVSAHADGNMVIFDREREDPAVGAWTPKRVISSAKIGASPINTPILESAPHVFPPIEENGTSTATSSNSSNQRVSWNPLVEIVASHPSWHINTNGTNGTANGSSGAGVEEAQSSKKVGKNPLSHWRVSRKSILDFVYSPDVRYVACISEDGCLRIIDALTEKLVDCYASYFGAFTCLAWSPDGRFILTGGQDDLVTIYSPWEQRVIARCQGHSSFVSSVAFDESRCDQGGRSYRFGSVGEDCRLILWDFSATALHRPKLHSSHQHSSHTQNKRNSHLVSTTSLARTGTGDTTLHLPLPLNPADEALLKYHPAPHRDEVAVLMPVLVKQIEPETFTHISFIASAVISCTKAGNVRFWVRPLQVKRMVGGAGAGVVGRKRGPSLSL